MKKKLLLIFVLVIAVVLTSCGSFEKVVTGTYENDNKDSNITLSENGTFTAGISYTSTSGTPLKMNYHGKYKQKSKDKLELTFSIKNDTDKRIEKWDLDKENDTLIDTNRNITFKLQQGTQE